MIGKRLAHFEVTAKLGRGGMGEVYKARDTKLGREVALKILPAAMSQDPERLERFRREARAVASLNHPNIVTIYSVEEAGDSPLLIMELIDGETLDGVIPPGGLPLNRVFDLGVPMADALAAAHTKGITHRDMKPANVMVTNEGRIKILDFGLAKIRPAFDLDASSGLITELRTADGALLGTTAYMSPEQVTGREADPRSDQFSLGILLYEMLTGNHPFQAGSPAATMAAILRDEPVPVASLRRDVPSDLAGVIGRCLAKDPSARHPTCSDLVRELERLRESLTPYNPSKSREMIADPGAPWVAVRPLGCTETDPGLAAFSKGLADDISTWLSKFPYLLVASTGTDPGRDAAGCHFQLQGSVRRDRSTIRVNLQLIECASSHQLWAETYDRDLEEASVFDIQDDLTHRIVATVADAQGVLSRSLAAMAASRPSEELNPYETVLLAFAYAQHLTEEEHQTTRARLERTVASQPTYPEAWAVLAMVVLDEVRLGFNPRPDSIERARQAAQRAVHLNSASQLAHRALAEVHLASGDLDAFRTSAERAIELNPCDTENVAGLGLFIAMTGDWKRGLEICERAMNLNPHHPGWYRLPRFFDHYRQGRYDKALEVAMSINMPGFFMTHVCRAIVYIEMGDEARAKLEIESLLELMPDFAESADALLAQFLWGDLKQQVIEGLRKAGLDS